MTRRIAQARDAAARSQQAVEAQRAYLETVLGRLSSGVIAFDPGSACAPPTRRPAHPAHLEPRPDLAPTLARTWSAQHPRLTRWVETVRATWRDPPGVARRGHPVQRRGPPDPDVPGQPLPQPGARERGHVVVFDDVTTLIMAQRDAAWGEVARRLAHEIKNPLTPIQLSAERLRHKLLAKLPEADARAVDRATHTIVQQVEAMKAMVNDFSSYARTPRCSPSPWSWTAWSPRSWTSTAAPGPGHLEVCSGRPGPRSGRPLRLRQVIHNLVKNAQEALEGRPDGRVEVGTSPGRHRDLVVGAQRRGQRHRASTRRCSGSAVRALCDHQDQGHGARAGHRQEDN
jgi:nitrogen fixation/metabolism regulation signal transduction histidine kinase